MQTQQDAGSNTTRAGFLQFIDAYTACDAKVAEAVGERKGLRQRIKGAGYTLAAFDRARKEAEKSGDKREAEDREFRRYMDWLGKPLGFQTEMFTDAEAGVRAAAPNGHDLAAVSEHQRNRVRLDGEAAGKGGRDRGTNPWSPGTLLYTEWDIAWSTGAEALAQSRVPEPGTRRGRGRPPGSRNRPKNGQGAAA
jgi:hypothetical protein